jgi:hypothetical protein
MLQAISEWGTKNFTYFTQECRYRRDVLVCFINGFTKPVGIERGQQIPCRTPPRMSVRSDTQLLDSGDRAVNGMLGNPQFLGTPLAGSV